MILGEIEMSVLAIIGIVVVFLLAAEACYILPDKMPWNRRKKKRASYIKKDE